MVAHMALVTEEPRWGPREALWRLHGDGQGHEQVRVRCKPIALTLF